MIDFKCLIHNAYKWWAVVDRFRQIHEMRTVIIFFVSGVAMSLF